MSRFAACEGAKVKRDCCDWPDAGSVHDPFGVGNSFPFLSFRRGQKDYYLPTPSTSPLLSVNLSILPLSLHSFNSSIMSLSGASAGSPKENITVLVDKDKQLDPTGTIGGHILDINEFGAEGRGLQTAPDGKTLLIPQPSSDPNDPLNWNALKKHVTLFVITVVSFMPDFASSIGIVALLPQAVYVALNPTR